jgi:hypothetical protein
MPAPVKRSTDQSGTGRELFTRGGAAAGWNVGQHWDLSPMDSPQARRAWAAGSGWEGTERDCLRR